MAAAMLDTLRCAQTLKAAGFPDEQADATAQLLGDALADVATKEDLDEAIDRLKAEIAHGDDSLRAEMNQGFAALRAEMDARFTEVNHRFAVTDQKIESTERTLESMGIELRGAIKGLERQMNFLIGFLGLLFAMAAYGIFELVSTPQAVAAATPTQTEARPNPP